MRLFISVSILILVSCNTKPFTSTSKTDHLLSLINEDHPLLKSVFENPNDFEVQILYTQINRDANNKAHFNQINYRVNEKEYFYPASSVKMPTAFAAIELIQAINSEYGIDIFSPLQIDSISKEQSPVTNDETSADGNASIAHYVKRIFAVSDNDAYNRLYEFCGQARLNNLLQSKGLTHTVIRHRLSAPSFNVKSNQLTNPFKIKGSKKDYFQLAMLSNAKHIPKLTNTSKGNGFIKNGILVNEPIDFSEKNYISLKDNTGCLQRILFPTAFSQKEQFEIDQAGLNYLYKCMSIFPRESAFPTYKEEDYEDSYVKFFLFGDAKKRIPNHIRIFNKVGYAYGYLTDIAYIVDFKNKVEFMLSATIHVNKNQIYNDNIYEYDSIGIPFLAELGRQVYKYELIRKRPYPPNLEKFEKIIYK